MQINNESDGKMNCVSFENLQNDVVELVYNSDLMFPGRPTFSNRPLSGTYLLLRLFVETIRKLDWPLTDPGYSELGNSSGQLGKHK